jgi:hypothetical protein
LDQLRQRVGNEDDFPAACMTALINGVSGILGKQGRIVTDRQLIVELALRVFCNDQGSAEIGHLIAPIFENAAKAEGYRFLPAQSEPIVKYKRGVGRWEKYNPPATAASCRTHGRTVGGFRSYQPRLLAQISSEL